MLSRLLAKRVTRRYAACGEFIADYEDFERRRAEGEARRHSAPPVPQKQASDTPLWLYIAIGAGVLVGVFLALYIAGIFGG